MDGSLTQPGGEAGAVAAVAESLRGRLAGEVRFDPLSRTLYATDASIYEIIPAGVVLPATVDDVVTTVNVCRDAGLPVIARGAGTGLAGGAVGPGVQLDLSRHLRAVENLDVEALTVDVEPGVVLDELNAELAGHGLMFAPDVATSSRATIGGMIANNSCGARSVRYGRTVDHVLALTVVLGDGRVVTFGADPSADKGGDEAAAGIEAGLSVIRDRHHDEIVRRFPKVLRSNGGYGLDRLGEPGTPADAVKVLCGSEGTLGIVVRARLRLVPIPRHVGLVVLSFDDLFAALGTTPSILRHEPSAVELVDALIIEAGRANEAIRKRCDFLSGDPRALMIVELQEESADRLATRVEALLADGDACSASTGAVRVSEPTRQADVWNLRKAGLGLLMSKPGDAQPNAFVEDSAVDPSRLRDYIERFAAILKDEGVDAGYYAHASVGCIHVRPVINLKLASDIEAMRRIADRVSDLACEFGGAMTGEHGDGIVRSCWIEKTYGPVLVDAFREVKRLFDSDGVLNPHKIVDPWPMTEHLRYGASFTARSPKTHLDFTTHGGMAGLVGMCSGVGQCRQRLVGTMCPSFMATDDEQHTTRARANALRVALSDRGLLDGLDDPHLAEVMDLCIGCKACKTECPTGVDMARLKVEYLSHRNRTHGATKRARMVADLPHRLGLPSRFPRLSNLVMRSPVVRALLESRYGLDRRVPPPRLANRTFRDWFRRYRKRRGAGDAPRGRVVYFVDTWTNHYRPEVGVAAVTLLERAGYEVLCPRTFCCGRPAISQGLLVEAKQLAEFNVRRLSRLASEGVPIVGTEPSCTLTLVDEYPQLVRLPGAARIAAQTSMIETFLRRLLDAEPEALTFHAPAGSLRYHAHCHQKALVGSGDAVALMRRVWSEAASEIDSGCCGMAGAFGHEVEHYDVSRAIGEQRLFPAVRNRGAAEIAVSGFSCHEQIQHHTGVANRHLIEYLADALA